MTARSEEEPLKARSAEATRFSAILSLLVAVVPEIQTWWDEDRDEDDDPDVLTLSDGWLLVNRHLFDNDKPVDDGEVWPRLLRVVEVALELCDLLSNDDHEEDCVTVDVFAGSGIMCDITRNREFVQCLLPWMGPLSVDSAQIEVSAHASSRSFDVDDVEWALSGTGYERLAISTVSLRPTPP